MASRFQAGAYHVLRMLTFTAASSIRLCRSLTEFPGRQADEQDPDGAFPHPPQPKILVFQFTSDNLIPAPAEAGEKEIFSSWALFILIVLLILALFTSYILQSKKIQAVHETVISIIAGKRHTDPNSVHKREKLIRMQECSWASSSGFLPEVRSKTLSASTTNSSSICYCPPSSWLRVMSYIKFDSLPHVADLVSNAVR